MSNNNVVRRGEFALSERAAARAFSIPRDRLRAAIASGELPAYRPGRQTLVILRPDLEAWLRRFAIRPDVAARLSDVN